MIRWWHIGNSLANVRGALAEARFRTSSPIASTAFARHVLEAYSEICSNATSNNLSSTEAKTLPQVCCHGITRSSGGHLLQSKLTRTLCRVIASVLPPALPDFPPSSGKLPNNSNTRPRKSGTQSRKAAVANLILPCTSSGLSDSTSPCKGMSGSSSSCGVLGCFRRALSPIEIPSSSSSLDRSLNRIKSTRLEMAIQLSPVLAGSFRSIPGRSRAKMSATNKPPFRQICRAASG